MLRRLSSTAVQARVHLEVVRLNVPTDIDEDTAFIVVASRKSHVASTKADFHENGVVPFDSLLAFYLTLFRIRKDTYQSKEFELKVLAPTS